MVRRRGLYPTYVLYDEPPLLPPSPSRRHLFHQPYRRRRRPHDRLLFPLDVLRPEVGIHDPSSSRGSGPSTQQFRLRLRRFLPPVRRSLWRRCAVRRRCLQGVLGWIGGEAGGGLVLSQLRP